MTLTSKMTVEELISIRKMTRSTAEEFISRFDLTPDELSAAHALMKDDKPYDPRMDNRMWVVVSYLLGASLRQIAKDKGVSPQSVFAQIERVIPDTNVRRMMRLKIVSTYEAMSEYKVKYFSNLETLRGRTPVDIATWLLANTELDTDEA